MDTKPIQQYREDILCYRLRTARQKKRVQYEDFDKQLIQLHKEEKVLHEQKRNLGWEPLIPPVQKGWKRFFVLRDDVAQSKQAEFFEGILKKINTFDWSHRKEFVVKRRKRGKKIYVEKEQKLLQPCPYQFRKLDFSDREKQMFHEVFGYDKRGNVMMKRYVFNEPWRFVLRVRPNIISRVRIRDSDLEARIEAIREYKERNDLEGRQLRLLHGSCWWLHGYRYEEKYRYKNWPLERILDDLKNEF